MSAEFPEGVSGWPGSDRSGPDTDSTDKKKKEKERKKNPASSSNAKPETHEQRAEKDRVAKTLAEFFVSQEPGAGAGQRGEHKKKAAKEQKPARGEIPEPDTGKAPVAEQLAGQVSYNAEHPKPGAAEAAVSDTGEAENPSAQAEAGKSAEREDNARWSAEYKEVPLDMLNSGEVLIQKGARPSAEQEPPPEPGVEAAHGAAVPELIAVPAYQMQPEQQHQARDYDVPSPETEAAVAPSAEVPLGVPPETAVQTAAFEQTPMVQVTGYRPGSRRPEPAEAYRSYMEREATQQPTTGVPNEQLVTRREAEDAAYYAERSGQNRGLTTGLFLGWLWGRHRVKKLRRQFGQQFKKQEKQLHQVREDQHFYFAEQTRRQAESDHQLAATEQRLAGAEQRLEAQEHAERQLRQHEPETPEQLTVPVDHRLETSAWHTIEVDTRTGRPVEEPAFAYGHEYYRERAHESTPAEQRNAAAGGVVLSAAAASPDDAAQAGSGPQSSAHIPDATAQGPPASTLRQKTGDARELLARSTAAGPLWPYLLALVVIVICLAFLLR